MSKKNRKQDFKVIEKNDKLEKPVEEKEPIIEEELDDDEDIQEIEKETDKIINNASVSVLGKMESLAITWDKAKPTWLTRVSSWIIIISIFIITSLANYFTEISIQGDRFNATFIITAIVFSIILMLLFIFRNYRRLAFRLAIISLVSLFLYFLINMIVMTTIFIDVIGSEYLIDIINTMCAMGLSAIVLLFPFILTTSLLILSYYRDFTSRSIRWCYDEDGEKLA